MDAVDVHKVFSSEFLDHDVSVKARHRRQRIHAHRNVQYRSPDARKAIRTAHKPADRSRQLFQLHQAQIEVKTLVPADDEFDDLVYDPVEADDELSDDSTDKPVAADDEFDVLGDDPVATLVGLDDEFDPGDSVPSEVLYPRNPCHTWQDAAEHFGWNGFSVQ